MNRISLTISLSLLASTAFADDILTDTPPMQAVVSALALDKEGHNIGLAIDQDQSIHHFSLKPSQAQAITDASTLVTIGSDLFPQINKSFNSLNPKANIISIESLLDHDPHFWMSPQTVISAAKLINDQYPDLDPSGERIIAFEEKLNKIDEELSNIEFTDGVIAGHDAFSGFVTRYGIPYFGALTDEHDHAAAPKHHHEIEEAIESGQAKCLILDTSEPSPDLEKFARNHGLEFVYVDILGWQFIEKDIDQFFERYYTQLGEAFSTCTISEPLQLIDQ